MAYYIFIMSDESNEKFLVGVCPNLPKKVIELKNSDDGKVAELDARKLVYFEEHNKHDEALRREQEIKSWDDLYLKQIVEFNNQLFEDKFDSIL